MDEIKRIYSLLSCSQGLKLKDIAAELRMEKFHLAEIMFSEEHIPLWYQNNFFLWFAKEGALKIEEKRNETLIKQSRSITGSYLERYIYSETHDGLRFYLRQILAYPNYTSKETNELFERYKNGDRKAYEQIVKGHLKLVVNIARLYRHRGVVLDELIQEGNIGLLKAIALFDHTKNGSFSEYAKRHIFQSISTSTLVLPHLLTIPTRVVHNHYILHKYLDRLEQKNGFEPPISEVDHESLLETKSNSIYNCLPYDLLSINVYGDCDLYESFLPPTDAPLMKESLQKYVDTILNQLDGKQKLILTRYWGIGCAEMTLEAIGKQLDLSRERIRQIMSESIQQIRDLLDKNKKKINQEKDIERENGADDLRIRKKNIFSEKNNIYALKAEAKKEAKKDWNLLPLQTRAKMVQIKIIQQRIKNNYDQVVIKNVLPTQKSPSKFNPYTFTLQDLVKKGILTRTECIHCQNKGIYSIGDVQRMVQKYQTTRITTHFTQYILDIWFKISMHYKELQGI